MVGDHIFIFFAPAARHTVHIPDYLAYFARHTLRNFLIEKSLSKRPNLIFSRLRRGIQCIIENTMFRPMGINTLARCQLPPPTPQKNHAYSVVYGTVSISHALALKIWSRGGVGDYLPRSVA